MSYYPYLLLAVSCGGVVSNVASLFVFARQRFRKMFHRLLVLLALYDFMVSRLIVQYGEANLSLAQKYAFNKKNPQFLLNHYETWLK